MPKITVIMPAYKAAKTITYSIDALLSQTFKDIEVLVVDDFSPDDTYDVCMEKYKNEPRVIILRQEKNQGPAAARNRAIEEAAGDYITFLDSDDGIVPDALETLYEAAQRYDADVVHSSGFYAPVHKPEVMDMMTVPKDHYIPVERDVPPVLDTTVIVDDFERRFNGWIKGEYNGNVWGKLFKTSLLRDYNIRFADLKMSEDVLFAFESLMKSHTYVKLPFKSVVYRMIGESLSRGKKDVAYMLKLLEATFDGNICFKEKMMTIPYFKENPDRMDDALRYVNEAMDAYYITPAYQAIGEDVLKKDSRIHEIFVKFFNDNAIFMERYFYMKENAKAQVPPEFYEEFTYEKGMNQLNELKNNPA